MPEKITLADQLVQATYAKRSNIEPMTGRSPASLRDAVTRARRFVLDDDMSRFMADLSTAVYRVSNKPQLLDSMRHSALLPHPTTWVEFNGRAFRDRVVELEVSRTLTGEPLAASNEIPQTWGLLLEQHPRVPTAVRLTEILSEADPDAMVMPITHVWNAADAPLPWGNVCNMSGMIAHGVIGYVTPYIGTILSKHNIPGWTRVVRLGDAIEFETDEIVIETSGVVRYALSFLAALNDLPAVHSSVSTRQKFYVRGQYKRFLDHTVIHLNLPSRSNRLNVARRLIAKIHRRAHMVRGHWKLFERMRDRRCEHQWTAIDESNRAYCCLCPSWRTWTAEHQRGDASLGFVTQSYNVHHPEAA